MRYELHFYTTLVYASICEDIAVLVEVCLTENPISMWLVLLFIRQKVS